MAITGFTTSDDKDDYDYFMKRYKREGLNMFFYDHIKSKNTKLGELKRSEIIGYIEHLNKPRTYSEKGWYKILNDVLTKQRQMKLEKIKCRL